ncbi:MAG TPA: xanthine dehydrogenase family protein molybdopterin-binding subunit [Candidatus Competibacter sp.]|nr:xanthine dehydrogenase family protein molybdopterin-binding subunit [Candidatus Competibacter sp.]
MHAIDNPGRRTFLKASAALGAGLTLGFYLPPGRAAQQAAAATATAFAPNAFLRIAPDNTVTVLVKHLEMGQGVYTGLPMLVAEELEVPWEQIRVESAPADAKLYGNLAWGGTAQGTGGSTSLTNSWDQLRQAGATAREMLIAAAAVLWKVEPGTLKAENGSVVHPQSQRRATYGELVAKAAELTPPQSVKLKAPTEWKIIGKSLPRKDGHAKAVGQAQFAGDLKLPGLLTALVARPPLFGARVKSVKADTARAVPGVKAVVQIPQGVAVVARDFWAAKKGRDALTIEWDETDAAKVSSDALREQYLALAKTTGKIAADHGDAAQTLSKAAKTLEATFTFPYLAHAPMEPLVCVVQLQDDACEIWAGSQLQTLDQAIAAKIAGLKPEQVTIHTTLAGGSFGRHANPTSDYIAEAVATAKATRELNAPIRLMWTREDDIKGGYYRPSFAHRIAAGLDAQGKPVAWLQRIVGQSIVAGTPFKSMIKNGIDPTSVEGAANLAYAIPNLRVELHSPQIGVPVLWWRSVGHTHVAFATEVFIDELAAAAGQDPYEYRRALLTDHPRHRAALELVAEKAGWGTPLPKGRGRGIAVHESFDSFVAEVAEVTVQPDGNFKVDRVVCAVDCGVAVNPNVIEAQMQGGIGFGLAAALHGKITLKDGRVEQSNYADYPLLRIGEMPQIEVHIVPSEARPTGVGEPGVPPIAPAVANALYAATGKRVRDLPIDPAALKA